MQCNRVFKVGDDYRFEINGLEGSTLTFGRKKYATNFVVSQEPTITGMPINGAGHLP